MSAPIVRTLCSCALNALKGGIALTAAQRLRLKRYKRDVLHLVNNKASHKSKKDRLLQKGGFLSALLAPALAVIPQLLASIFGR